MDRHVGGQCRRRPGQDEDHHQPLDPPALANEEARQHEGQEHLHVHADDDVEQRVDDGRQVARIGEQLLVKREVAAHPKPEGDRIDDEKEEDRGVGQGEGDRPDVVRAMQSAEPGLSPRTRRRQTPSDRQCLLCCAHDRLTKLYHDLREDLVAALERLVDRVGWLHVAFDHIGMAWPQSCSASTWPQAGEYAL